MNIQEYDLMNELLKKAFVNQRILSENTGYSLGKVNGSLKTLINQEYLDTDMHFTIKALEEIEIKKPKNAIILAAGFGMRMVPINMEMPKGLLEVKGELLIERLIKQLQDVGVTEIDIVVGFMKEQYEYLIDKYNVRLIYNKDYAVKNNLYSLLKLADKIKNTYIIPCDIWCKSNPFSETEFYSWYLVNENEDNESTVRINRKRELVCLKGAEKGNCMIGISYILEREGEILKKQLKEFSKKKEYIHSFWEEALIQQGRMIVYPKIAKSEDIFEINTLEELRELDENSNQLNSKVLEVIKDSLQVSEKDIVNIKALKKGMTNRSFEFQCKEKKYIMRIPGEGTDRMINRNQEYNVYQVLQGKNICDSVIYISPDTGYKITKFLKEARVCNPKDFADVRLCMERLRRFHEANLKVEHTFHIFKQIEFYEKLRNGEPSIYRDYELTKEKMYELKRYIDKQPKQISLTHIDAVPDNFLIQDNEIYLIDWEYAGMQDVHVDIAMFGIYAMYDRTQMDNLIDAYFNGDCEETVRKKIYCYIAICGLLWSNWCEYKRICGVEFGEYSLRQYRYAKEYYKIIKEECDHEKI
ncbi:phosphotransferase [Lachnospiraceae bacterium LCP25S3_G4]